MHGPPFGRQGGRETLAQRVANTHAREAGHGTQDAHGNSGRVAVASLEPEGWIIVEMWVDQAMLSPA